MSAPGALEKDQIVQMHMKKADSPTHCAHGSHKLMPCSGAAAVGCRKALEFSNPKRGLRTNLH